MCNHLIVLLAGWFSRRKMSYLCEAGFSAIAMVKSKYRPNLHVKQEMRMIMFTNKSQDYNYDCSKSLQKYTLVNFINEVFNCCVNEINMRSICEEFM